MTSLFNFFRRSGSKPSRAPLIPDGIVVYAVGDIHGRADLLDRLLNMIKEDAADRSETGKHLIFLGDYIDRGPDSRRVIDRLMNLNMSGFELTALKGNHEAAMLEFLEDPASGRSWMQFGGDAALLSYGVARPTMTGDSQYSLIREELFERLPEAHLAWLQQLPHSHRIGGCLFVHAGIRPGTPLDRQADKDLMFIRDDFLFSTRDHGAMIVHGHSITAEPEIRSNRIGIDTGAYASGILTCAVLHNDEYRFLQT